MTKRTKKIALWLNLKRSFDVTAVTPLVATHLQSSFGGSLKFATKAWRTRSHSRELPSLSLVLVPSVEMEGGSGSRLASGRKKNGAVPEIRTMRQEE